LLNECWRRDIVTVVAAGNNGEIEDFDLSQDIPACLGRSDNPLITVGSVDIYGNEAPHSTKDKGRGGSITTYAQGVAVRCANNSNEGFQSGDGTSLAAPQVAGLAAYFLSLPAAELPVSLNLGDGRMLPIDLHERGKVSQNVKNYIASMSYARSKEPKAPKVAYNGAQETCEIAARKKAKRNIAKIQREEENYGLTPYIISGTLAPGATFFPASSSPTKSYVTNTCYRQHVPYVH
jgi:subtilisin family serine protease